MKDTPPDRDETREAPGDPAAATLIMRPSRPEDGPAVWRLVRETGVLDVNSPYAYTLLLDDFGDTCVIAEEAGGTPLGFVLAYRPPRRPHAVFVWQVAVSEAARGRGLGGRMLEALVRLEGCRGVTHLEATVTPSNQPSRALFRAFGRRQGAEVTVSPRYTAEHFPDDDHEPEELFSIGPFDTIHHHTQDPTS